MLRLTGISGEARYGKRMTGADASKNGLDDNSKVLKMGKDKNPEEEEDNAVKKLQSQINILKDKISELSKNETMDPRTKAELIQSTKEEITELSVQMQQRKADLAVEKMEEEEKAQEESGISTDKKEVSDKTGKAKYDTYSKDGEDSVKNVSNLSAAVISASNSIKLSRMQRYNMIYKNNSIGILKKEITEDTDYIGSTKFLGYEKKEIGQVLGDSDSRVQAESADENGIGEDSPLKKKIEVPVMEKKFDFLRGAGIELKEEQIVRFKTEISGLRKMQAGHLGDALRSVNEYNEDAQKVRDGKTGRTSETAGKSDEAVSARLPGLADESDETEQ